MSWFEAFKSAYDNYPSQDNEGYVPERGSFKAGFTSAWHHLERYKTDADRSLNLLTITLETIKFQLAKKEQECERLKRIIAKELTENDEMGSEFVYVNALKERLRAAERLAAALKDIFALMDEGWLGRDTSKDHEPGWAMKQIEPIQRLKKAHDTLAEWEKAGGKG